MELTKYLNQNVLLGVIAVDLIGIYGLLGWKKLGIFILIVCLGLSVYLMLQERGKEPPKKKPRKKKEEAKLVNIWPSDESPQESGLFSAFVTKQDYKIPTSEEYNKNLNKVFSPS